MTLLLTPMIALTFLNSLLLWGVPLASVPLIIHILNRRRFKTVHWAAMEYLLRAFKENKRKMRFEQLLLLLLRMAAVALLAFFLARPNASSDDLGGLTRRVLHHLVVLDDSASMGERFGNTSCFDQARQQVASIAKGLGERRGGDLFTLLRTSSDKPDFLCRPVAQSLATDLTDILRAARPSPDHFDLAVTVDRARTAVQKVLPPEVEETRIYLISDLRKADLIGEGKGGGLSQDAIKKLRSFNWDKTRLDVLRVGNSAHENLAITSIKRKEARSVRGQPSHFLITVQNQGARGTGEGEISFSLDGGTTIKRPLPSLGPGTQHTETFKVDMSRAGSHYVQATIAKDRLAFDDARSLAFPVAESASVLLVDGDPGENEFKAESYYMATALDADEDGRDGFLVSKIDEHQFGDRDLEGYDLVILANVATLPKEDIARLEKYVAAGGGLMLWTGDQVDATLWNQGFWKDGKGLLPAPLLEIAGDLDQPDPLVLVDADHPIFAVSKELIGQLLSFVRVGRYHSVGDKNGGLAEGQVPENSKVLIRAGRENGAPILIERSFGDGRVALFTTAADAAWSSFPGDHAYALVLRESASYLMRTEDLSPFNLAPRGNFTKEIPVADFDRDVVVGPVKGDGRDVIPERHVVATMPSAGSEFMTVSLDPEGGRPWPASGVYRVDLSRQGGDKSTDYFTVDSYPKEGLTAVVEQQDFLNGLPGEIQEKTRWHDTAQVAQAGFLSDEGEIWRYLAFVLIGFLLLETFLAWKFGHG